MNNMSDGKEVEELKREMISIRDRVLSQKDLYEILPFGKTKIHQLLASKAIPMVRVGNDYIMTFDLLEKWIEDNLGKEIYYY